MKTLTKLSVVAILTLPGASAVAGRCGQCTERHTVHYEASCGDKNAVWVNGGYAVSRQVSSRPIVTVRSEVVEQTRCVGNRRAWFCYTVPTVQYTTVIERPYVERRIVYNSPKRTVLRVSTDRGDRSRRYIAAARDRGRRVIRAGFAQRSSRRDCEPMRRCEDNRKRIRIKF